MNANSHLWTEEHLCSPMLASSAAAAAPLIVLLLSLPSWCLSTGLTDLELNATFHSHALIRRQYLTFDAECGCTKAMHATYSARHSAPDSRTLVIDGTTFRWEGLGNSGTRWMGLLRWGYATGRTPYLQTGRDCAAHPSLPCRLDLGTYFTGYGGAEWHWGTQAPAVRRRHAARGERPLVLQYHCHRHRRGSPGCDVARLTMDNGSQLVLAEPGPLLDWFRTTAEPWIRLVLAQQDSLEGSYSRPESLRASNGPLVRCPVDGQPNFRVREVALKCETFAFMQPRAHLMRALLPHLRALEPFDTIVGVHLRTGYADWAFRNDDSYFGPKATRGSLPTSLPLLEHWRRMDDFFRDCRRGQPGPCFNWESPRKGHRPHLADAMECGGRLLRREPSFPLGMPRGFLSALLLCAVRTAQTLAARRSIAKSDEGFVSRRKGPLLAATARSAAGGLGAADVPRWGLLVLSDAPAFPSLAMHVPSLQGRVVNTAGSGQLGHSSFDRSCSSSRGCSLGPDPGGAWTRSLVDFYLAGAADGFVKGLFTSFLFSTMRRNLLCCRPGAFVQWLAWYNKSTHRDFPNTDREFMAILAMTHGEQEGLVSAAGAAAVKSNS